MHEHLKKLLKMELAGIFALTINMFLYEHKKDVDEHVKDYYNEMFKIKGKFTNKLMHALDKFMHCSRTVREYPWDFGKDHNNIHWTLSINFENVVDFITM